MKTDEAIKKYVVAAIWLLSLSLYLGLFAKVNEASGQAGNTAGGGWNVSTYEMGLPKGKIYDIINKVALWMLGLFGFFGVIGFVVSGVMYLTASGDDDQQKKAKQQMYWSITGVIVGLIGFVVLTAVSTMLGGTDSKF